MHLTNNKQHVFAGFENSYYYTIMRECGIDICSGHRLHQSVGLGRVQNVAVWSGLGQVARAGRRASSAC